MNNADKFMGNSHYKSEGSVKSSRMDGDEIKP